MVVLLSEVKRQERADQEAKRDNLYDQLEVAYTKIERALDNGDDATSYEDVWLALLNDYEAVCHRLELMQEAR